MWGVCVWCVGACVVYVCVLQQTKKWGFFRRENTVFHQKISIFSVKTARVMSIKTIFSMQFGTMAVFDTLFQVMTFPKILCHLMWLTRVLSLVSGEIRVGVHFFSFQNGRICNLAC